MIFVLADPIAEGERKLVLAPIGSVLDRIESVLRHRMLYTEFPYNLSVGRVNCQTHTTFAPSASIAA